MSIRNLWEWKAGYASLQTKVVSVDDKILIIVWYHCLPRPRGASPPNSPALGHFQTFSAWTLLYKDPPYMFKLVHYEARTVGKRAVCILLECFLVYSTGYTNTWCIPVTYKSYILDRPVA